MQNAQNTTKKVQVSFHGLCERVFRSLVLRRQTIGT